MPAEIAWVFTKAIQADLHRLKCTLELGCELFRGHAVELGKRVDARRILKVKGGQQVLDDTLHHAVYSARHHRLLSR